MATTAPSAPLSQGVGYGVIIGLGAFFAIVVIGLSQSLRRFAGISQTASEYAVASRSLGTGLTAAGAVSSWCWSVTLLSAVSTAYSYGAFGALVYGASNMSQITLFSLIAIQMKRKAPNLHTHLELLRIRYGTFGHATFLFFALATNILVVSSILVGAAATINSITGVNVYASLFLLPLVVAAYTLRGGLRSTILADYLHTVIIFIILFVFWFKAYTTSDLIGSPSKMYDLLVRAAEENPSPNYAGSYVTGKSLGAIKFAWLSFLEYTGVVFNDASFHQKGIAANPSATVPGYVIGSLSWFSLPWTLATTAGLVALALERTSPTFPTYPNRMTESEVSAGLVLPYAAKALLGSGGSAAVLLLMFMSSTSAISAQLIAVSSIGGYDIYKTYINPKANEHQILRVQQGVVVGFTLFMAAFGCLLHGVGVQLGFLYNITGVWSTAALPQICFSFFGSRLPRWAVFPGVWVGFFAGLAVWLSLAQRLVGSVDLTSLGDTTVCLYTFATTIATGLLLSTVGSLVTPQPFDWSSIWDNRYKNADDDAEIKIIEADERFGQAHLKKWLYVAVVASAVIFGIFMLIWPLSLYRDYVFTESFFNGWVIVSIIWALAAFSAVGLYPLWEGRHVFLASGHAIHALLTGRGRVTNERNSTGATRVSSAQSAGDEKATAHTTPLEPRSSHGQSGQGTPRSVEDGKSGDVGTHELSQG
ncbi:unnamed protein product [Parajaminaea phylloscopi]